MNPLMMSLVMVLLCSSIMMVLVITVSRLYAFDVVRYTFGRLSAFNTENSCGKSIRKILPNAIHFSNVLIDTLEIDMVSITDYGILVFEFKDVQGSIKGSSQSKYWTRSWKSGVSYSFKNPVMQNEAHILALKSKIPEYTGAYVNIIVFSEQSLLSDVKIEDGRAIVLHKRWIKRGILSRLPKCRIQNVDYIKQILKNLEGELNDN